MPANVTIHSAAESGEQFEITLEKTAHDKGTIRNRSWSSDHDPETDDADTDQTVKLYDITAAADGNKIVCKGDVSGPDPTVTCRIFAAQGGATASVEVTIMGTFGGFFDGTKRYPIAQADCDAIRQYVLKAGFPILA